MICLAKRQPPRHSFESLLIKYIPGWLLRLYYHKVVHGTRGHSRAILSSLNASAVHDKEFIEGFMFPI